MRFKELIYNDRTLYDDNKINALLIKNDLHWLIDSEIENASIEIKHRTLIWNSGSYYAGNWYYGIWLDGDFHGIWENGIFEGGNFKGKFVSGIRNDIKK